MTPKYGQLLRVNKLNVYLGPGFVEDNDIVIFLEEIDPSLWRVYNSKNKNKQVYIRYRFDILNMVVEDLNCDISSIANLINL